MRDLRIRRRDLSVLGLLVLASAAPAFATDTVETWLGGNTNWQTPADWTNNTVPNGYTYAAVIDGNSSISSTVSIGLSQVRSNTITLDSCELDSGDAIVVNSGGQLTTNSFTLNGNITVDSGGQVSVQSLATASTGTIVVNGGAFTATNDGLAATAASQPFTLENGGTLSLGSFDTAGCTVNVGAGTLVVGTLTNATGTVALGPSSTLSVTGPYTLAGGNDFSVQSGGLLKFGTLNTAGNTFTVAAGTDFTANVLTNTGQLNVASGAVVSVGSFSGGDFSVDPSAKFSANGITGGFTLDSGAMSIATIDTGTVVNNGTINLTSGSTLGDGSVTLSGSGTFNLAGSMQGHLSSFTNSAVIKGYGQLFTQFGGGINDSVTNHGTIEATSTTDGIGMLGVGGTVCTNAADGTILVDARAELSLSGNTVSSTGTISVASGGTLSFGNGDSPDTTDTATSIANNGTLTLNGANLTVGNLSGSGAVQAEYFDTITAGQISCASLTIENSCAITVQASAPGTGIVAEPVGALALDYGTLKLLPAASSADRMVLQANSISDPPNPASFIGVIDLSNNDLIIHNGNLQQIQGLVDRGYNSGTENGHGIISSSAAGTNMALGVLLNSNGSGNPIYTTFDGQNVTDTDVLVKYTLFGDANLDGTVDAADFVALSNNFGKTGTTWSQGNFNDDGTTDAADFILLSNNFGQSLGSSAVQYMDATQIAAYNQIAADYGFSQSQIEIWDAKLSGVPEPATGATLLIGMLATSGRRRCRPQPQH